MLLGDPIPEKNSIQAATARQQQQLPDMQQQDLPPPPSFRLVSLLRAAASLFAVVKAGESALKRARSASSSAGDTAGSIDTSTPSLPPADAIYLLSALDRMDTVFGVFYEPSGYETAKGGANGDDSEEGELPEVMAELLARRLAARESKDWATADAVRDEIKALGYAVKVREAA